MLMRRNCRGFACTKRQRAEFLTLILKLGQYIHANALSVNNLALRQQRQNPPLHSTLSVFSVYRALLVSLSVDGGVINTYYNEIPALSRLKIIPL